MRKSIILSLLLFIIKLGFAQQWNSYNPTAGFDINAVDILKQGHVVIGGGKDSPDSVQIMFSSSDYGTTWNENMHDGIASWNKSIAFADSVNGIGVGSQGRIISTNDGGIFWGHSINPINRDFNKVVNVTPRLYYAVGGISSANAMQTIIKSADSGITWQVIYDTAGPVLNSVFFTSPQKGFAVGDSGVVLLTTNGGVSWINVAPPLQRNLKAILFLNTDTGYIAGGLDTGASRKTIFRTIDGGANWTVLLDTTGGVLKDISFADNAIGYVVGDSATVLKTVDGGNSWNPVLVNTSLTGDEEFRTVKFSDKNFGVIGGKQGVLYVYTGWPADVKTLGSRFIDSTHVNLYASANAHGFPGSVSFTYSTDSTFATFSTTPRKALTGDTLFPVFTQISGLIPGQWYYYFVSGPNSNGDTLRFYTGTVYPVFQTLDADVIDSVSLLLKGDVHGFASVANLKFEYGTTPLLGSVIAASPANISDTSDHAVTASLTPVLPYTLYYYRLRGELGADTVYGDIYFAGNLFRTLETLSATLINDSLANLNGAEQGFPGQVNLSFEVSSPQSGTNFETPPYPYLNSDTIQFAYAQVAVQPLRLYYYRIKAITTFGVSYGKWLAFYTSVYDTLVQTLPAQSVTSTSAILEGEVNHFPVQASLSFEYSSDSSFSNSIGTTPATVTDTLLHKVSAVLSGVPVNTMYYYRLKATTLNGAEIYGGIRVVFIGNNEIPNWDFQLWNNDNFAIPTGWNIATNAFSRVPGHSGNYALNITGSNLAMLGYPSDDKQGSSGVKFIGGVPFTGRPDSLSFYIKGSLVAGDSAMVIVYLHQGITKIAKTMVLIPVNTGGQFKRVSIPIEYSSPLAPDSLILGITSVNPSYETAGNQINTVTVDDFEFIPSTTSVYNGDFETWFNYNIELPEAWYSPTFIELDSNNRGAVPMVTKAIYELPYDYAADVKSLYYNSIGSVGGNMGLKNAALYGDAVQTFPVNSKHQFLTGFCEAYPVNGDTMAIEVRMYKHGREVGYGKLEMKDSITRFTPFEIQIGYGTDTSDVYAIPDSADIEMRTHGLDPNRARGLSRLVVDKLRFDGFVAGIEDQPIVPSVFDNNGLKVYPNPSNDLMIVEIQEAMADESMIQIYNLNGQILQEMKLPAGESKISFSVSRLDSGLYLLRWINGSRIVNNKIVVSR